MIRLDARDVNRLMSQSGGQEVRAGISWFDNRSRAVIRIVYASSLQPGCSLVRTTGLAGQSVFDPEAKGP